MTVLRRVSICAVAGAAVLAATLAFRQQGTGGATVPPSGVGTRAGTTTSRADLDRVVADMEKRLAANPADSVAAYALADALLRKARVEGDPQHAIRAEQLLKAVLKKEPGDYNALQRLGAVYLSQHRFRKAIEVATRVRRIRPHDAWNLGVLGDGHLELGEYEAAFDAFDAMARVRPDAASYARVAYAHELQGRLSEALRHMRMAAEATGAHDPEALAWHYAQMGNILFQMGDIDGAAREFARSEHAFPNHPYARNGMARVAAAQGDMAEALRCYRRLLAEAPSPELASSIGDLLSVTGDESGAKSMYAEAEKLERDGWKSEEPQPAALARMLAERDLKTAEAVRLAEQAARSRSDIFTMDALAWAYYRAGRLSEARMASRRARRTGTADRRILYHAAAIEHALGDGASARALLERALEGHRQFDVLIAPAAIALSNELEQPVRVARAR